MKEELEKKVDNELTDEEMKNVSGGLGSESYVVETCPRCYANVSVLRTTQSKNGCFWKTINGQCEKCGYVIDVVIEW